MLWSGWQDFDAVSQARTADLKPMGEGRAAGLHLGAIIQSMRAAAGLPSGAPAGDQDGVRLQEGFLWESVVEFMLAGVPMWEAIRLAFARYQFSLRSNILTQIQLGKDKINMTPDALDVNALALESYKVTRKTLRKAREQASFEQEFWPWLVQEKAYLLAAQQVYPGINTVRWYVWWMAGDYSKGVGSGPRMTVGTASFDQGELETNWKVILMHKEMMP